MALSAGKLLKLERNTTTLIGAGTAICGGSAIAAVAPVIGARDRASSWGRFSLVHPLVRGGFHREYHRGTAFRACPCLGQPGQIRHRAGHVRHRPQYPTDGTRAPRHGSYRLGLLLLGGSGLHVAVGTVCDGNIIKADIYPTK